MSEELIGVTEAAAILGVQRKQVARLMEDGRLPFVTLPPRYRCKGVWKYCRRADVLRLATDNSWRKRKPRQPRNPDDQAG